MANATRRAVLAGGVALGLSACGGKSDSKSSSKTAGAPSGSASASSSATGATSTPASSAASGPWKPTSELPGGGTTLLPNYRLFGWCGSPAGAALGQLGVGSFDAQVTRMLAEVPKWGGGRKTMPVLELIATIVHPTPGDDGMYRSRVDNATLDTWAAKAKASNALLLINIQPGLAEFIDEAKYYEKWLKMPHVGLALDPEWKIDKGQTPGKEFGHTTGADVDKVSDYLASLCRVNSLPQKALIIHVLRRYIFEQESQLKERPEVAVVKSVDGIGIPKDKRKAYDIVMANTPSYIHPGFKIFFSEDKAAGGGLMSAQDVLALKPQPDYVLFE